MARGIYYGSYRKPRIALWTIGVIIFLLMIITAFMGYTNTNNSPKSLDINNHKIIIQKQNNFNNFLSLNKNIQKRLYSTHNNNKYVKNQTDLTSPEDIFNELGITAECWWDNLHDSNIRNKIIKEVSQKAGIYLIYNKITGNYYIGSAITNKLYTRFSNHLLNFHGSKLVEKSVKKYGLNNFMYGVIEYIDLPKIMTPEDKKELYERETLYIALLMPKYNILTEAGSSWGYKHSEENIAKMKLGFTDERRELLKKLQMSRKGKWTDESKLKLREAALKRDKETYWTKEGRKNLGLFNAEEVYLYDINHKYICKFKSINSTANYLCCSYKTLVRSLTLGHIFIPNMFIKHLNEKDIYEYNSIKDIPDISNSMEFIQGKTRNIKSGRVQNTTNTKFFITKIQINQDNDSNN